MPSEEHYDDSAFNYFMLAFLSIILIPSTIAYLKALKGTKHKTGPECHCPQCEVKSKKLKAKKKMPSCWTVTKFILYLVVWILFLLVLNNALKTADQVKQERFDPFEILGISSDAPADEIKKAYRKLSLRYHPDKDPSQTAAELFVKVSKAYDALTDPVTKANYEKYGHPDGPQGFSAGIALPSWLVDSKNSPVVLAVYIGCLVIVIPTIVCCWWYKSKKYTNKVMNDTLRLYYQYLDGTSRCKRLMEGLAASAEYKENIPLRPADKKGLEKVARLLPADRKLPKIPKLNAPFVIKTNALLHAHVSRLWYLHREALLEEAGPHFEADLNTVVALSPPLLTAMIEMMAAKRQLLAAIEAIELSQMITQACWKEDQLMQLPHFNEDVIDECNSRKWRVSTVAQLAKLHPDARKEMLLEDASLSVPQLEDIEVVLKNFPLEVDCSLTCGVENDPLIVPNAVLTLTADIRRYERQPPAYEWKDGRAIYAKKLKETEDANEKASSSSNNNSKKGGKKGGKAGKQGNNKKDKPKKAGKDGKDNKEKDKVEDDDAGDNDESGDDRLADMEETKSKSDDFVPPAKKDGPKEEGEARLVHAPYYPEVKEEKWWLLVGDRAQNVIIGFKPFVLKDRNEIKLQFVAPPKIGAYTFMVYLMCEDYIGADQRKLLKINVVEDDREEEKVDYGDIDDDDDEDLDDQEDKSDDDDGDEAPKDDGDKKNK